MEKHWGLLPMTRKRQTLAQCRPKPKARIYHPSPEQRKPNPLRAVIQFKIIPDLFLPTFCRLLGESEPSFLTPLVWRLNACRCVWIRIIKFHMYQQLWMKMHDAWCTFSMSVITIIFSLILLWCHHAVLSLCMPQSLMSSMSAWFFLSFFFFWGTPV